MPVQITVARQLIAYARLRADLLRQRRDDQWGASAIEWAIISAVIVTAAILIGNAIFDAVSNKQGEMCNEEGIEC
jgi:Flp pilus assembly pilin Flp